MHGPCLGVTWLPILEFFFWEKLVVAWKILGNLGKGKGKSGEGTIFHGENGILPLFGENLGNVGHSLGFWD